MGGRIVFFAQATCQDNWVNKQAEPSFDRWRRVLEFTVPNIAGLVIPFCFRRADGSWEMKSEVTTVLIDRVRLMWLMSTTRGRIPEVPNAIVDRALMIREGAG
jgi:hypothetical protein